MKIKTRLLILLAGLFLISAGQGFAADQDRDRDRDQDKIQDQLMDRDQTRDQLRDRDMIYGYELMTVEERAQHRAKMQSFNTEEEREAYREEHHKQMQARAKERGVQIPDVPRNRGFGPGSGMRSGGGTGSGGGSGKGR